MNKILADENIHIFLVDELINVGYDVVTVADKKLIGSSDRTILEVANNDDRILLTADKDFGGILEMGSLFGKGRILLLRYRILDFERIKRDLIFILKKIEKELREEKGILVVLSEGRYRIHKARSKSD